MRLLFAHLEAESEARYWRLYVSEQLWMLNAAWRKEWDYLHFVDMIGTGTQEAQRVSDERERQMVHEWLMGGG